MAIQTAVTTVINAIKTIITTVWNAISTTVSTVMNTIRNTISNLWNGIKTTITTIVNGIKTTVSTVFNNILSAIKTTVGNIASAIKSGFQTAINFITSLPSQALQWGKDMIMGIVNGIKSCMSAVGNAVKGVADKIKSFWDKNGIYISIDGNKKHFHESRLWWPYWRSTFWSSLSDNIYLSSVVYQELYSLHQTTEGSR